METRIITGPFRDAICILLLEGRELSGFAHGYKVYADQELERFGIKTRRILNGDYFFIERIFIEPHDNWQDTGRKLIEQILNTQTCKEILLCVEKESPAFEVIVTMGGEIAWCIRLESWYFMQLSIKK